MSTFLVTQTLLLLLALPIAWRVLKRYVVSHPMKDIPGPTSDSWWTGKFFFERDVISLEANAFREQEIFWHSSVQKPMTGTTIS